MTIFEAKENVIEGYGWTTEEWVDNMVPDLTKEEKWDLKILLAKDNMLYSEDNNPGYDDPEERPDNEYLMTVEDVLNKKYKVKKPNKYLTWYSDEGLVIKINDNELYHVVYDIFARPNQPKHLIAQILRKNENEEEFYELLHNVKEYPSGWFSEEELYEDIQYIEENAE